MDANTVKTKVEETWQDVSSHWKDEYATRYKTAVISELENTLDQIQSTITRLNEAIESALSGLREFEV